jgi:hypothetical protein
MIVAMTCLMSLPISAPPVLLGQTVLQLQPDKPAPKPAQQPPADQPSGKPAAKPAAKPAKPPVMDDDDDDDDAPKQPATKAAPAKPSKSTAKKPGRREPSPSGPEIVTAENVWVNKSEHYSLSYPQAWDEISQELVQAQTRTANQMMGMSGPKIDFVAGFKPITLTLPGFPYVLVQRHALGSPSHQQILNAMNDGTFGKAMNNAIEKVGPALSGGSFDKPVLDKERNILSFTLELNAQGVQAKALCALCLGKNGVAQINCYSRADQFENMLPVFTRIIQSVEFEPGFEYTGGSEAVGVGGFGGYTTFDQLDPMMQRYILIGLIACMAVAALVLLRALMVGGKRQQRYDINSGMTYNERDLK